MWLAVVVTLVLTACASGTFRPPAARIGNDRISDAELQRNIPLFRFLSSLSQQPCGQQDTASKETAQAACARFTLTNLIQEHLIDVYAAANDVSVPESDVSDTTSQLESRVGGHEQLVELLSKQGMSIPQLRDLTGRLLLFNEVRRDIASGEISDAELHQAYEQTKAQYVQIHVAHILVEDEKLADEISAQVDKKNFAQLAQKYSTDTASAKNGGDIGTQPAGQLDPTFTQAALSLKPGEISKPVQTQFGWHIIMLIESSSTPFKDVKAQLLDQASAQSFDTWLSDTLRSADIHVNPRYGRLNLDSGQVEPITSTATGSGTPTPSGAPPGSSVAPSP